LRRLSSALLHPVAADHSIEAKERRRKGGFQVSVYDDGWSFSVS
jgi:hypothetical protein